MKKYLMKIIMKTHKENVFSGFEERIRVCKYIQVGSLIITLDNLQILRLISSKASCPIISITSFRKPQGRQDLFYRKNYTVYKYL